MHMKTLALATLTLALSATTQAADKWSYTGKNGAEHWGESFATCGEGKNQTPINITMPVRAKLQPLDLQYQGEVVGLHNNGHTVQADIAGLNSLIVDGQSFDLKQFHFHTPSENFIKNKQYPLEAHFVHADEAGNLAVVAVMFEAGMQRNKTLAQLLEETPSAHDEQRLAKSFNPAKLLPDTGHYYRFTGSLTTPPCSEGVRWFVMQQPLMASKVQLGELEQVMGRNNRPLQPLNARLVMSK